MKSISGNTRIVAQNLLAGIIFVCLAGAFGPNWATAQETPSADPNTPLRPLQAKITTVTGNNVQYSLDNGKTWQSAVQGTVVSQNAVIRTGFASGCEVSFQANTVLQIEALSSVRIADYMGNETAEKVTANLQYGAVRCGVEMVKVKSDTRITTSVATLAIRGTITRVEYDRGTNQCELAVEEHGPAEAITRYAMYTLREGMKTDAKLSRHLKTAIFGRSVFVTGSPATGGLTDSEADSITNVAGAVDLSIDNAKTREDNPVSVPGQDGQECPGGECPIGPSA